MNSKTKVRVICTCFGFAILFAAYGVRLVQLQVWQHDSYVAIAAQMHVNKEPIVARRGAITDVNGELLATDEPQATLIADGSLITKGGQHQIAGLMAGPLGMKVDDVESRVTTKRLYSVIKRRVPETVADDLLASLKSHNLRGIHAEQSTQRIYPNGTMLCHVLGFMNTDGVGVQGVESTMEKFLRGYDGFRFIERDVSGHEIVPYRGQERPAHDGDTVALTIDMNLQNIVENELDDAVKKYKPHGGAIAIMMRPQTGEILAMANRPNFDLNDMAHAEPVTMKNMAILNMVEPGSTFKIVTTSASLNESLRKLDSVIFCENGSFLYAGRRLHDDHRFGDLSVEEILEKSSNIGAAKLALELGDQRLYDYIKRYGFGERTGINLPGEISGVIHPPYQWSKIDITRIPMGQSVGVTPLQIATAMCVIANGGKLMMPQIIHEVRDEDGNVVKSYDPVEVRRVISEQTASEIRSALTKVVSKAGTAPLAQVPGFTVGGKTGTAQKPDPHGGYAHGKYVVSFVGFLPADHPKFVCLVMIDDAQVGPDMNYGGQVAAPVFRQIAEKTANYMNLVPDPNLIITQNQATAPPEHD